MDTAAKKVDVFANMTVNHVPSLAANIVCEDRH